MTLLINYIVKYKKNNVLFSSTKRSNICKRLWIFVFFAKNKGKNIGKNISKNLRGKYSQKLVDHAS